MSELWIDEKCPKCEFINWANCGDIDDITGYDVEGIICWNCKNKWWICEDVYPREVFSKEEIENYKDSANYVNGNKNKH